MPLHTYLPLEPGDIDGDGIIDEATDFQLLKNHILKSEILTDYRVDLADVNKDNEVNIIDLLELKARILAAA